MGKTTTAHLVCKENDFEVIELNASDARSKKTLSAELATLLGNTTMTQFWKRDDPSAERFGRKQVRPPAIVPRQSPWQPSIN